MTPQPSPISSISSGPVLDEGERKFLVEADAARAFWEIATAKLQPRVEVDARPIAYSRTTYYDTPDLAYYRSGHTAVARRLRVREYGHAAHTDELPVLGDQCFVELKQSANGMRSKARRMVDTAQVPASLTELAGDATLEPCVATWYRRRALTDGANTLRVTLDDHLMLCRPRPLGSSFSPLTDDEIVGHGPAFIVEVKSFGPFPGWLSRALEGLQEAVGFSKFMLGMGAVEQSMRLHRRAA